MLHHLLLIFCLLFPIAARAESPWVGTWKMDVSKSRFANTFSYTQTADGMMHYVDGSDIISFRIDGKPYSSGGIHTSTWTSSGPAAWDSIHKAGDVVQSRTHRQLSADGRTFTMVTDGTAPDGSTFHYIDLYSRVSGTTGLLGTWRSNASTTTLSSAEEVIILPSAPGTFHERSPKYQTDAEGRMDGSEIPLVGPQVSPGVTMAITVLSTNSFSYKIKVSGQVRYEGVRTLAEDEKSYTDTSWTNGNEADKSVALFVRE